CAILDVFVSFAFVPELFVDANVLLVLMTYTPVLVKLQVWLLQNTHMADDIDQLADDLGLDSKPAAVSAVSGVEAVASEIAKTDQAKADYEYKLKALAAEEASDRARLKMAQETLEAQIAATEMALIEKELKA